MSAGRPPAQFEAVRRRLRDDIDGGRFAATGLLPAERNLSAQLSVSRTTIRRVLAALVDEGRLSHRHGIGTFVRPQPRDPAAPAPPDPAPASLAGFSETMRRRGFAPASQVLSHDVVEPSAEQAMLLAASPRETVVRLRRLRHADGEPVQWEENMLPLAFGAGLDLAEGSLYAALRRRGLVPARALQRVRAALARPDEADRLGVAAASAVILLRRADYLGDGRCLLLTAATVRADRFDLLIELGAPLAPA